MEVYGMTGERLGTIESSEKDRDGDVPQWQRDFLSKPSISIRKGIAWGYDTPYEDTDTMVLTSPSSKFVDMRLPTNHDSNTPLSQNPAFWAFTGTSSTTFPGTSEAPLPYVAHSVWKRDIDSQGYGISDEGDMFVLPNGDCAETGMMENPKTGKVEMYKEYWTSPKPNADGTVTLKPCVVAQLLESDEDTRFRGLIIRIGDYCQGILGLHKEGKISVVETARYVREAKVSDWQRDERSGLTTDPKDAQYHPLLGAPCSWVCQKGVAEGDELTEGQLRWKVLEVVQ